MAELVAFIPQSHYQYFNFSVFDMVLMGTTVQISAFSKPGKKQIKLVDAALERLGICHLKNRGYTKISGGERQGVPSDVYTEELIRNLYAAEVKIQSLYEDKVRVSIPKCAI